MLIEFGLDVGVGAGGGYRMLTTAQFRLGTLQRSTCTAPSVLSWESDMV
ncbi:MAG: hypothetical protein GTO14_02655 [Anaerolineales bacterium]|nr:hypothetical protein [Anaerolineales bacterium]